MGEPARPIILTVGHSTRSAADFCALLRAHGVTLLVDIRTVPRSRHNPQFDRDALPATLAAAGIAYRHLPTLGGLRRPRPDSTNDGWRNDSFRGFADYMQTPAFAAALEELLGLAATARVAVMCAEAVPWRCHRSLVADALVARGVAAAHVTGTGPPQPHRLTPFAVVAGERVTYPAAQGSLDLRPATGSPPGPPPDTPPGPAPAPLTPGRGRRAARGGRR